MAGKKVVAITAFVVTVGKTEHFVHEGEHFPTTHRLVREHPELFSAPEAPVEAAPSKR